MNAETPTGEKRTQRKSLLTTATFAHDGGGVISVRVRNLSACGLGGVASTPLTMNESYAVELKGVGAVRGTIVWVSGARFGMRFDEEVSLEKLKLADPTFSPNYEKPDFYKNYNPPEIYRRPRMSKKR